MNLFMRSLHYCAGLERGPETCLKSVSRYLSYQTDKKKYFETRTNLYSVDTGQGYKMSYDAI